MYSVFGGMPYFNSLIEPSKGANENIVDLIVKDGSILEHEINEMVLSETSKIEVLNDLIYIVGSGTKKYKDVVSKMNQLGNS